MYKNEKLIELFIFFKSDDIPMSLIDPIQFTKIQDFKKKIGSLGGLYKETKNNTFESSVRNALSSIIQSYLEKNNSIDNGNNSQEFKDSKSEIEVLDEDQGFYDLIENAAEELTESSDAMSRMTEGAKVFSQSMIELNETLCLGNLDNSKRIVLINKFSERMQLFSDSLKIESGHYKNHIDQSISSLTKSIYIFTEDFEKESIKQELGGLVENIADFKLMLQNTNESMNKAKNSIAKFPRVTSKLNRSKKDLILTIEELSEYLSRSQIQFEEIIILIIQKISKLNKEDDYI